MKFDFKRKVLKNGMTVLFEKRDIPVVSVAFAARCGGINESSEEKGISHFIEHMLYKGTPTRDTKKIAGEIEKNGGELNGFTDDLITAYWCKMPSKHLEVALDVLGDMVRNPLFDQKELEKERQVIFEEIKMNHDTPMRHAFKKIHHSLFGKPFGEGVLGNVKSLNSIDREIMSKRFNEIYQPNNLVLCVVGDADFNKVVEFAEKNFPADSEKGKVPEFEVKSKTEEKIEKREGVDQANLVFAYHTYNSNDKRNYAARILSKMMAEGLSSRLFSEIREKRNLAYSVKGGSEITKDFGYNFIYVGTMKENVEKVKELILKEFEKIADDLEEEELNQIKEQIIGQWQINMEDSQNQMVNLLYSEIDGDARRFYDFEENIKDVKLEDVKELAKKAAEKYSFFALVPED